MDHSTWLTQNRQAILDRIHPLQELPDDTLYAEVHGAYIVAVTKGEGNLRLWLLDPNQPDSGVVQSEMSLDDPLALFDDYTQAALLGLLWQPAPRHVYVAGLGGGCVPLVLHHYFPDVVIDCSEIEPIVIEMATRYFGLGLDERLHVAIADGREYLAAQPAPYDFIFIDVFLDHGYVPYCMSTVEFYTLCRDQLTPDGILVVNLLASDPYLAARIKGLQQIFPAIYANPLPIGNILLYASHNTSLDIEALIEQATQIQRIHHFGFPFAIRSLDLHSNLDRLFPQLASAAALTDDAPPAGYFDLLPSFADLPVPVAPGMPCLCGSGLPFALCHGQ